MTRSNSTPAAPAKPQKPQASFADPDKPYPLTVNPCGYYSKKVNGRVRYYGRWDEGPEVAEQRYNQRREAHEAGRDVVEDQGAKIPTVKVLCNKFLNAKRELMESGELAPRTWNDYKRISDLIMSHFGKTRALADVGPDDFAALRTKMAKKWGPVTVGNTIQRIRVFFKYAYDAGLIPAPMRYGPGFKRPSKKTLRLEKAKHGKNQFAAAELRSIMDKARGQMKAMILLGINCGFGNSDCATLPMTALDLEKGWVDYPRPKTGIARRCCLWLETIAALQEALARRYQPKDQGDAGLVFITKRKLSWGKETSDNPISKEMRKLLDDLGMNGHRNFYTLRHTFRTVADEAKDQPAIDHIMGHESPHMSSVYRESIADARLKAVTDHVHSWLFGQ
jgi:integrase